ncbi:D-mannose binding lectin, partial [Klenkia marina]
MPQVRRRRALRSSVLAASLAVLASLVVAPPALAEDPTAAPSTGTSAPTSASSTDGTPTTAAPITEAAPTTAPTTDQPVEPAPVDQPAVEDSTVPDAGDVVVGELQQAWPDPAAEDHDHHGAEEHTGHDDHAGEQPLSWIDTGDGTAVRVPTDALPDVTVGSTISVTVGDPVTDEASTEQGFAPAVDVQSATVLDVAAPDPTTASAGSTPTNTVTAVLVLPSGATADGTSISTVVNALNADVSPFWDEQSNGTVRISAAQGASGWITSAQACSAPFALWSDVARQIGWTEGAGKHLMLYVPRNAPGCAYGLGTVGSSIGSGGYSYVQASRLSVMGHELGHNFGLGHSSELQCNSSLEAGSCRTRDYYDFYDIMGISWDQVGTLNAAQAARLGLLPSSEQVALTTSNATTTVTLVPVAASSGTRAIKLTAADGTVYYLEYRQASGRDAWLGDSRNAYGLTSGVVLRRASSGANTSLLLDGSPSGSAGWDGDMQQALPVGAAVQVAGGDFHVVVQRTDAGSAAVRVRTALAPTVTSLLTGDELYPDQSLVSANGAYRLVVQADGNLVVYGAGDRVVWASYSGGSGARAVMQADGNLVVYGGRGEALWSTRTYASSGGSVRLSDDGAVVVSSGSGAVLWSSGSDDRSVLRAGQRL